MELTSRAFKHKTGLPSPRGIVDRIPSPRDIADRIPSPRDIADRIPRPSLRRGSRPEPRQLAGAALAALTAGAAGAFFLDPQSGKQRRHVARDRIAAFLRRRAADAQRKADYAAGHVKGAAYEATRPAQPERPAPNDQALTDRVKSEIFRPADAPKDSVNVNVEDGVVYLRGEVKRPEDISALVDAASSIDGVRAVESLLHLPGTPVATKADGGRRTAAATR